MGILIIFTMSLEKFIDYSNVLSLFIFIILVIHINKSDYLDKSNLKKYMLISIFFGLIFLIGNCCYINRYSNNDSIWNYLFNWKSIICIIGYSMLFYLILISIIPKVSKIDIFNKVKKENCNNKILLKTFIIIFVCWIPYFLIYYPGLFSSDSISEITMIVNGDFNDHHTVIHLLFCLIPYKIGMFIFKSETIAASLITLFQMATMAIIYAYTIKFLSNRKISKKILILILLYFAVLPVHAYYSITIWKDVIFSGCVLLLTLELIKLLEKKQLTIKNSYSFIIVSIITILFRNNAIYMYVLLAIVTVVVFRKNLKTILLMLLIVFGTYGFIKGPVYNQFNIKKSSSSEYIAIPLQQIGRMAYKDVKFTKYEKKMINKIIPINILKEKYNPEIVDSIKFNENYNITAFEENKFKYLKLWIGLCVDNFGIATESYLISTLGYWYPNVNYWSVFTSVEKNDLNIKESGIINNEIKNYVNLLTKRSIPLYGLIWSIGLCIWIIIISIVMILSKKNKKSLYVFVPIIGIWLSLMVATPVFAEFRYMYCAFTTLPILLLSYRILNNELND